MGRGTSHRWRYLVEIFVIELADNRGCQQSKQVDRQTAGKMIVAGFLSLDKRGEYAVVTLADVKY
jgi:hypothetical protein